MVELNDTEREELHAVAVGIERLLDHHLEVAETLRLGAHISFEHALDVMTTLGESVEGLKELRDELRKLTRPRPPAPADA